MLISKTHRISKVIAAILLTVIVSVFSYSELGQYGFNNPTANDYCEIVKSAQASKDLTSNLFKLQVDRTIYLHCTEEENQLIASFKQVYSEQFHTPQKTTEVYLFNRTFLI
ncbi:MAG: hypothetical protein ACYC5R_01420 [Melioribacteraceae bacterium]